MYSEGWSLIWPRCFFYFMVSISNDSVGLAHVKTTKTVAAKLMKLRTSSKL